MGLIFKDWQRSQYMMQLMMLNLVACFACLSGIAFAQFEFSEALSGSVSFPDVAFACIGNLAVFFTSLLRGRLDLENGARDVLATNRGPELVKTNESQHHGWTTCEASVNGGRKYEDAAVVMLSGNTSNPSVKQFMRYIQHSHGVHSILLKCLPLLKATHACVPEIRSCYHGDACHHCQCRCVLVCTEEEEIRMMVARRMPGTLKQLSGSVCLLPSAHCLRRGCHGCDQGVLHAKESAEDNDQLQDCLTRGCHGCEQGLLHVKESAKDSDQLQDCLTRGCHGCEQGLLHAKESAEDSNQLQLQPERRSREEDSNEESRATRPVREVEGTEAQAEVEEPKAESRAGQIHVDIKEDTVLQQRLTKKGPRAKSPNAVSQIMSHGSRWVDQDGCMCIPLREAEKDEWTRLMIRFMRSKDTEVRGVRVLASDAMEKYIDRSGESAARLTTDKITESYSVSSLLVQRFIEIIVNVLLTGWLRVDGLSSSLMARRVVRDYLVDSKGTGFAANAFLTQAIIECNRSSVCQLLRFSGNILGVRTLAYVVGCVNLICSIGWVVVIASEASVGKWYAIHSMPPSKYRVIVILVGIGIALLMDYLVLVFLYLDADSFRIRQSSDDSPFVITGSQVKNKIRMVCAMMVLEIIYIAAGCVLVVKGLIWLKMSSGKGRWVYSALQILIWLKWGIGSFLLGDRDDRVDYHRMKRFDMSSKEVGMELNYGVMVYSSAFMLNAILAGVRGKW